MAVTVRITRPRAAVFDALVDPETYPHWLIGAQEIRATDPDWPAPGSAFHHRVGLGGPVTVADKTVSRAVTRPRRLELEARARPFGRARVRFELTEVDADTTEVSLDEVPLGALSIARPLLAPLTRIRNRHSLDRLAAFLQGPAD